MNQALSSITVVIVVNDSLPDAGRFDRLADVLLAEQVADFDFVLIANAVDAALTLDLKDLVSRMPDTAVVFLNQRQHDDVARLVGIDHAVGDFILCTALAEEEIAALPALLAPLRQGYDLVVADPSEGRVVIRRPATSKALLTGYLLLYRALTGLEMEDRPTGLRILSRSAALFVGAHPAAELMLRSRDLGPGFPVAVMPALPRGVMSHRQSPLGRSWSAGVRMLLGTTSLPLRAATYLGLVGGVLSLIHGAFVISVYTFKDDVQPGWTTTSLQLAAMMFIFSILFMLLSEYVLQIHAANPQRSLRHLVLRELRSPLSRRSARLNIVDAEGRFQLGAPLELLAQAAKEHR